MPLGNQTIGNQTLGRGEIHFSLFRTGYTPDGFRYVGNTPEFSYTSNLEKLDHFSSDHGIREKDKSVVLQTDFTASLTMDDIQADNLALTMFGSASVLAQSAASSLTETFTDVTPGLGYQVGLTDSRPAGYHSLASVVVKVGVSTKTITTDYTVDTELGIVTPVVGGGIVQDDEMIVEFNVTAKSRIMVVSGAEQVEGALRFISYNAEGDKFDYYFPYVKLGPNGDIPLKTDEWMQLPFTVEILKRPTQERIYCNGRPYTP